MSRKVFVGPSLRRLREQAGLTQAAFAQRLSISVSYLNQIENNQRPVTASVLMALGQTFGVDLATFAADDTDRLVSDLREALSDPLFRDGAPGLQDLKRVAGDSPSFARAFLRLHQTARRLGERLQGAGADPVLTKAVEGHDAPALPYEEVRDFFHYHDNYVDDLDRAAEQLSERIGLLAASDRVQVLAGYLASRYGISVDMPHGLDDNTMHFYDQTRKVLTINSRLETMSKAFILATRIARLEVAEIIGRIIIEAGFRSQAAQDICRVALGNYFAGALVMPYRAFLTAAKETRHDIDRLSVLFSSSIEQVMHRLSSLQRPGFKGIPFFFVKVDRAGNMIKRHSATRFQFARFGALCPLWNVFDAFERPGKILVQLAEMPDGSRFIHLSLTFPKQPAHWRAPERRFAFSMGCDAAYASDVIYTDGLDVRSDAIVTRVGTSCRLCEREDCFQRAMPPIDRDIRVPMDRRSIIPFDLS